jgi:hypothetical protein
VIFVLRYYYLINAPFTNLHRSSGLSFCNALGSGLWIILKAKGLAKRLMAFVPRMLIVMQLLQEKGPPCTIDGQTSTLLVPLRMIRPTFL